MSWLFSAIILPFFIFIILRKCLRPLEKKIRLPPGPRKLPIIGNLHQLTSKPHQGLAELAKVYGPIMHLRLGEIPTVVVSSAEIAREFMKHHDTNFADRPKILVGKILYYDYSDIGLAPYGEYWRQVRKIATLELFTAKQVEAFRAVREKEVADLAKRLTTLAASGSVINLSESVFNLTFDITYRLISTQQGRDRDEFRKFSADLVKVLSGFCMADVFPSIKVLHSIGGMKKKLEQMLEDSNKLLDPIIKQHIAKKKQGGEQEDLVDVLLVHHRENRHPSDSKEFYLLIEHIKSIILELFSAGSETSHSTTEWAMSELLKNPTAMQKAQAEVRKVYKGKPTVDETCLDQLEFLNCVIKETLRLHPPAPLLVPRECIEQVKIQGYDILPETRIYINAWAISRDPRYWPEPNTFKPERFESCSVDYKGTNFEYIPFGAGRRMCPGITLGIANVVLPLAMLLYNFDWKLPNEMKPEDLDMDETFALTVRRRKELHAIATPYTSSSTFSV